MTSLQKPEKEKEGVSHALTWEEHSREEGTAGEALARGRLGLASSFYQPDFGPLLQSAQAPVCSAQGTFSPPWSLLHLTRVERLRDRPPASSDWTPTRCQEYLGTDMVPALWVPTVCQGDRQ